LTEHGITHLSNRRAGGRMQWQGVRGPGLRENPQCVIGHRSSRTISDRPIMIVTEFQSIDGSQRHENAPISPHDGVRTGNLVPIHGGAISGYRQCVTAERTDLACAERRHDRCYFIPHWLPGWRDSESGHYRQRYTRQSTLTSLSISRMPATERTMH
jgi:hypothetical protein